MTPLSVDLVRKPYIFIYQWLNVKNHDSDDIAIFLQTTSVTVLPFALNVHTFTEEEVGQPARTLPSVYFFPNASANIEANDCEKNSF